MKKIFFAFMITLFMSGNMNAKLQKKSFVKKEVSCLQGAHIASNTLGDVFGLSYEAEYLLFSSLLEACVQNGGWE